MTKVMGKYFITFNGVKGDYEVGDIDLNTLNYYGNSVKELKDEVLDSSKEDLVFRKVNEGDVVGLFEIIDPDNEDDIELKAILFKSSMYK